MRVQHNQFFIPFSHSFCRAMVLDVGGLRHKVLESNFNIYPNARLGKLLTAKTESEILNLCDGYKPGDILEFFFNRNWLSFNSILDIYQTGVLHLNTILCALVIPYRVEQGACREPHFSKTGSLHCEQDPCNDSRFSLWECGHREYLFSLQGPGLQCDTNPNSHFHGVAAYSIPIIRPGRLRLLRFEIEIVLVV